MIQIRPQVLLLQTTLAFVLLTTAWSQSVDTNQTLLPPVQLSATADHQRLMGLLHMTNFRRRKDDANYDESKANPYPGLPDPLTRQPLPQRPGPQASPALM